MGYAIKGKIDINHSAERKSSNFSCSYNLENADESSTSALTGKAIQITFPLA
jgi:hypothetical protein